jgi:CrcB protein
MLKVFALALAGAVGTLARYGLTVLVHRSGKATFPIGTLAGNLLGCFVVGIVMYLVREHESLTPETRAVFVVGLLGGFTTFSAFGYETFEFLRDGALRLAAVNVVGNVVAGICAVWLGFVVGRVLAR